MIFSIFLECPFDSVNHDRWKKGDRCIANFHLDGGWYRWVKSKKMKQYTPVAFVTNNSLQVATQSVKWNDSRLGLSILNPTFSGVL